MSWHDSRIIEGLDNILEKNIEPSLIKVGQYFQWNCGYKIYKL